MKYTEDGKFLLAGNMDSVKVWEIEQSRMADIIMKPQSVIYDLSYSKDFIYCKSNYSDIFIVAEFNSSSSSVVLS
jgi:hypothetical protein